jgi:hypothetical protein
VKIEEPGYQSQEDPVSLLGRLLLLLLLPVDTPTKPIPREDNVHGRGLFLLLWQLATGNRSNGKHSLAGGGDNVAKNGGKVTS